MDPVIESLTNPSVKRLVRLQKAAGRRESGSFVVEGRRAIDGLLSVGWEPRALWLRDDVDKPASWPTVAYVSSAVMAKVSSAATPSGYLAEFAIPEASPPDPARGGLVLAEISDPGNLGTLIRTAAAIGWQQVVVAGGADPYAPKVVQATAGALAAVQISRQPDVLSALAACAGGGPRLALVARDGEPPRALPTAWVVVGSEADGLSPAAVAACDVPVTLPMPGAVESLNAAVAGAIACYLVAGLASGPAAQQAPGHAPGPAPGQ